MDYKYKISVVIPVYNVEKYISETIDSVIKQTLGFKNNIQIVLINDGSTDNSEKVCLKYKNRYPDNIVYYAKENEGVSAARNFGLKFVEGKYINFLDSDDIWDSTAFEKVYNFLEENQEINMASCRVKFFGIKKGFHILDYRFSEGTKIININEKPSYIQTFIATVFFRHDRIKNKIFDKNLKYAEDVKFVNELFFEDNKYALISDAIYYYRKREDASSATQMGGKNKFYYDALKESYLYLAEENIKRFGEIKEYFQNIIMYELQWRLKKNIDTSVINQSERNDYVDTFKKLLNYIDDNIILGQIAINYVYKLIALQIKYGEELKNKIRIIKDEIYIDKQYLMNVHEIINNIEISKIESGNLYIDGSIVLFDEIMKLYYTVNNEQKNLIEIYNNKKIPNILSSDDVGIKKGVYNIKIPLKDVKNLEFELKINDQYYKIPNKFVNHSSINNYRTGYYYKEKYLITKNNDRKKIKVEHKPILIKLILKELYFLLYLLIKKKAIKPVIQRVLYWITKSFMPRNIWLFADREFMARDSAEQVFKYTNSQENLNKRTTYFAVDKKSEDYKRMKQYGKVVGYHTLKYKLLFLNAKYLISSHADAYVNNEFGSSRKFYVDLYRFKYIYLTHGVLLHDSSSWLNRINKNIELNVVTSPMEYESILEGKYYFKPEQLIQTGLPRNDKLFDSDIKEENKILIMASWRSKLAGPVIKFSQKRAYNPKFKESEYYNFYNDLFNDKRLQETLKKYNYKIKFCIHPSFRAQLEDFKGNEFVEIAIDVDSQYETVSSKMLITDYSSAACDFAYLRKPVIYANFDLDHIYDIHYYNKGYFDYDIHGFGPNCKTYDDTINEIIKTIENNCKMEEKYKRRCDKFFYHNDNNSAKRVYEALIEHEKNTKE